MAEGKQIGQVTGLAWTEVGGDLLTIEVADMPGKGVIQRTGSLGDVMKESVEAARTVVRSRARRLGFADSVFEKHDMHARAGRRDAGRSVRGYRDHHGHGVGPVAHPVRADVAMTGEITLRRSPAHRRPEGKAAGRASRRHQDGLDSGRKRQGLGGDSGQRQESSEIVPVRWIDKVLELALERLPEPLAEEEAVKEPLVASRRNRAARIRCSSTDILSR